MGIFPTLIFLLSLIPFLPVNGFQDYIINFSENLLPEILHAKLKNTIDELFFNRYKGLVSIGFILSLYYASLGINTLFTAFSQSYQIKLKNNYFKQQLLSLFVFMSILFLFILATLISHLNEEIFRFLFSSESTFFYQIVNFLIQIILVMLGISFLFHFGNPKSGKFKLINAGTVFSTFVIIVASAGLSFYFKHFNVYNKIYGSIGSLLITLVWLNVVSYVLMIGFELYAKIDEIKNKFSKS